MADPDTLIQKVLQKVSLFDLDVAIPNLPKRLKREYDILRADSDKIIFRKIWEKATPEEKIKIESDMDYELESPRSRSQGGSRSRSVSRSQGSRSRSSHASRSDSDSSSSESERR
ncbi:MAG: hypothetical protein PHG66_04590 [Candidatus Colwellbacteria bacterium]|nr:hypothetical protein [Candidatus Colwellbacteria bacterium]